MHDDNGLPPEVRKFLAYLPNDEARQFFLREYCRLSNERDRQVFLHRYLDDLPEEGTLEEARRAMEAALGQARQTKLN
jgi:hypothetical protein